MTDFKLTDELERYVIEVRRDFHRYPELPFSEERTSAVIRDELTKFGIRFEVVGDKNVVGIMDFGGEQALAIRADIDALPITEETDVPWKSEIDGVMHACGHDGHTAILLGVAKILSEKKAELDAELSGKVYLCFQQAEEKGGAVQHITDFLQSRGGVDHVICIHLMSELEPGKLDVSAGLRANGAFLFRIDITGVGGHGSQPEKVVNVLEIATDIYQHIIKIPVNHVSAAHSCVVSPCVINVGNRFNVFPDKGFIEGTVRYAVREDGEILKEQIENTINQIAALYGGKAEITYDKPEMTPIINDEAASKIGEEAGSATGFEIVRTPGFSASDDFCEFLDIAPGFYGFVGSKSSRKGTSHIHHTTNFDIDESVLGRAAIFFCECTRRFL